MIATPFTRIFTLCGGGVRVAQHDATEWEIGRRKLRNDFGLREIRLRLKRKAIGKPMSSFMQEQHCPIVADPC
jgi:hypothetical protein